LHRHRSAILPGSESLDCYVGRLRDVGIALVVRPVGALIFGRMADLRGRTAVFVLIIVIMAGATATVGLLLGYAATGAFATVRLILLRAVQGLAAGGELGVAGTLILEAAPRSGNGGRALSNSAASEWAGDDRWPCYGAGRRHGTCGGSDPGLTLAPDLDQIDAGIPQRVNESPERGIV
jgi:hypothetical protein